MEMTYSRVKSKLEKDVPYISWQQMKLEYGRT